MIANFIAENTGRIWSDESESGLAPCDGIAEFANVLPQTLHLTARKLWAISELIAGVKEPDEWAHANSLDACEMLVADAGHDIEILIGDFERWLQNPRVLQHRWEEAIRKAEASGGDPDKTAACDLRKRSLIAEIVALLRAASLPYVLGFATTLKGLAAEDPGGSELGAGACATGGRDADAAEHDEETSDDAPDGTIAAIVFVGPEDGQVDDTLDLVISKDRYAALRQEVRKVVAAFAAGHAESLDALAASSETEATVRPASDAEPGRQVDTAGDTILDGADDDNGCPSASEEEAADSKAGEPALVAY